MRLSIEKHSAGIAMAVLVFVYALFDTLLEWILDFLHMSFELFEFSLDKLVEHIFHTGHHTTQTIVFYLMLLMAGSVLYKLIRLMPDWYRSGKYHLALTVKSLNDQVKSRYRLATARVKLEWWAIGTVGAGLLLLGVFS